jgi:membrane protease YdiL (CAAX protease family)
MQGDPPPAVPVVWAGIALEGGLGLLAVLLGWACRQPPLAEFRWGGADAALGAVATVPMLLIFFACVRWPVGPLARIRRLSEEFIRPLFASCTAAELGLLALAAGLGEEMLFRGFLQSLLVQYIHFWPGLVAASVVFGLLHLITPTYAVLAALLGLYLGYLFAATHNLLTVIIAHALYDFIALAYLVRRPRHESGPS